MEEKKACCFLGHRKTDETPELIERLTKTVEVLITGKGVNTFYFGSKSNFDDLCHEVVTGLKKKYPHIKRIYVRSAFPDIDRSYEEYLLESYEETYFLEKMRGAGRASYVERNREMIDKSDICIMYLKDDYFPENRKSGTKLAYEYAKQKKRNIINLAE